ncbi:hypothetical protein B0H13DRAFT_340129 [Mycena leptocephala]|nr:hypothetical protein B0H13DRAFT_340129 [Mycena leptocephala]
MTNPPAFPLELEREIFMTAAIIHEGMIPTLLRVAHRVLVWIEPLLYRRLIFNGPGDLRRLSPAIRTLKAKPPVRKNVRAVGFWWYCFGDEEMRTLLSLCPGIESLVLPHLHPATVQLLESLPLRRLTYPTYQTFFEFPLTSVDVKFFADLTHLHINSFDKHWPWISALPSLTHLCFKQQSADRASVETFLRGNKRLRLLVCTTVELISPNTVWIDDPRVVLVKVARDFGTELNGYERDWASGAGGGRDFWVRVEEFLAKKQGDESITTQVCENVFGVEPKV